MELNKIYNMDCLEYMDLLIAQGITVDAIITDPPYGTTACKWDTIIPFDKMWERLNKLIKPNGAIVLFGNEPFSSLLRVSNLKMFKYDWIWDKKMVTGFALAKKQPMRGHEIISVFYKAQPTYNFQKREVKKPFGKLVDGVNTDIYDSLKNIGNRGIGYPKTIIEFPKPNNLSKKDIGGLHPTQKPVALIEYLIKTYTNENEIVLDFTMGSGTTAVAARNLNRNFYGCELDAEYCEIANKRLQQVQLSLF